MLNVSVFYLFTYTFTKINVEDFKNVSFVCQLKDTSHKHDSRDIYFLFLSVN